MIDSRIPGPVTVHACGPGQHEAGWSWRTDGSLKRFSFSILLISDGACSVTRADGSQITAVQGDLLLMRWDHPRTESTRDVQGLTAPWCSFDWRDPDQQSQNLQQAPQIQLRHLRDPTFVATCMQRVIDESVLGRKDAAEHYLSTILLEFTHASRERVRKTNPQAEHIAKICRRIQRRPEGHWSVPMLAREHGCDPDHFGRVFRQQVGESPGRYVIGCRLQRARFLLLHTKHTIKEIAEELGYCDPYAFSKQFKRFMGTSPRGYRDSYGTDASPARDSDSGSI